MSNNYCIISLRIEGFKTDPIDICRALKMEPAILKRINDPRVDGKGNILQGVYNYNLCSFRIAKKEEFNQFEGIVKELMHVLSDHKDLLQKIRTEGGSIDCFIGWFTGFNSGFVLNHSLLRQMGELGIDLRFDIYGED